MNALAAFGLPGASEILSILAVLILPIIAFLIILVIAYFVIKCAHEFVKGLNDVKRSR